MRPKVPVAPLSRRAFLYGLTALGVVAASPTAHALAPLEVTAPNYAVAAIVRAVGGDDVRIKIDRTLAPTALKVAGGQPRRITDKVMLKGGGVTRARFLDDPRNAPKLGANIRDLLALARPELKDAFVNRHRTWSHDFTKQIFRWQSALQRSAYRGQRMKDPYGRIYLLQWAGIVVDPKSKISAPAALRSAPGGPAGPTPKAYIAYIDRLVGAIVAKPTAKRRPRKPRTRKAPTKKK